MIQNPVLRILLHLPVALFSWLLSLRPWLYQVGFLKQIHVSPRVVSIGNLTSGGTGKTPFTLRVAQLLKNEGFRVAIVCRGYKRTSRESCLLVSDGKSLLADALASGDEAQWLARRLPDVPIVVGRSKSESARWIEKTLRVDWIIVDDGFQHLRLARDKNLLLLDADQPFDNGQVVPLGRLREPPAAIRRCDLIAWIEKSASLPDAKPARGFDSFIPPVPQFKARREFTGIHTLEASSLEKTDAIKTKRLVAFCGLARHEQFFSGLAGEGWQITTTQAFPDHHRYRPEDIQQLLIQREKAGADGFITTAKDAINLSPRAFGEIPCYIFEVAIVIDDEPRLLKALFD